ncbi:MAG TPA: SLOG family protein [Clostridia bacterium]|nr:SLOG family protein [Clostridia bacterium]
MSGKVCCVTGHRVIPEAERTRVEKRLREEVRLAVADGYTVFLSGFADGADLMFARAVLEEKAARPDLRLVAAIPHAQRLSQGGPEFQELYARCDDSRILSPAYHPSCYAHRNRYMVSHSQRIIAVYDGRGRGGTMQTLRMAREALCEIRCIHLSRGAAPYETNGVRKT